MGLTVRILIFVLVYWLCNVTFISEKCFRQSQWVAPVPMTIIFTRAGTSLQQLTRTDVIGDCSNLSLRTSRQFKFRLVAKKNRFEQWLFSLYKAQQMFRKQLNSQIFSSDYSCVLTFFSWSALSSTLPGFHQVCHMRRLLDNTGIMCSNVLSDSFHSHWLATGNIFLSICLKMIMFSIPAWRYTEWLHGREGSSYPGWSFTQLWRYSWSWHSSAASWTSHSIFNSCSSCWCYSQSSQLGGIFRFSSYLWACPVLFK